MAAMKPRTGDGPLEVTKEGRGIIMRVPLEGGGRLVVELTPDEAKALGDALMEGTGGPQRAPVGSCSRTAGPGHDVMSARARAFPAVRTTGAGPSA